MLILQKVILGNTHEWYFYFQIDCIYHDIAMRKFLLCSKFDWLLAVGEDVGWGIRGTFVTDHVVLELGNIPWDFKMLCPKKFQSPRAIIVRTRGMRCERKIDILKNKAESESPDIMRISGIYFSSDMDPDIVWKKNSKTIMGNTPFMSWSNVLLSISRRNTISSLHH